MQKEVAQKAEKDAKDKAAQAQKAEKDAKEKAESERMQKEEALQKLNAIVKMMLEMGLSSNEISEKTGLSDDEIKKIQK
jgi:membrane protein involved in colicin uptake